MVILEPARNINTLLQAVVQLNQGGSKKFMAQIAGSQYGDSQEHLEQTIMWILGQGQLRLAMKEIWFSDEKGLVGTNSRFKSKKWARSNEIEVEEGEDE
ncbi:MAG: hypothetical protein M1839_002141 [Geoglossum umbratile]|nr:MAG: hypothetical protein M1839_002141 [Geoglossum umbratile]